MIKARTYLPIHSILERKLAKRLCQRVRSPSVVASNGILIYTLAFSSYKIKGSFYTHYQTLMLIDSQSYPQSPHAMLCKNASVEM